MTRIAYETANFRRDTLTVIEQANSIITEYRAEGYDLTLRQLYYQFVARDLLGNTQQNYKRLGDIVSKGRRAGLIDWEAIVDRTRNLQRLAAWDSGPGILESVAGQYREDRWRRQPYYVEVWFEKDALMGVFERPAEMLHIPFFSCRGYTSDSEVWSAAMRLRRRQSAGKPVVILHFGDHDPSGIDMTRDITDRLRLFGADVDVRRLALNMEQVERYNPPPNPAKESDSRFAEYERKYGDESWELDAMSPDVLATLVVDEVRSFVDQDLWNEDAEDEYTVRCELLTLSRNYRKSLKDLELEEDEELRESPIDWHPGSDDDFEEEDDDE